MRSQRPVHNQELRKVRMRASDFRGFLQVDTFGSLFLGVLALVALFPSQANENERSAAGRNQELALQQDALESKLVLVRRMLESESAQRVLDADNSVAVEKLNAAQAAYLEALRAIERQQIAKASFHADEALRLGVQAIRVVAKRPPDAKHWANQYSEVRARVSSYREAYARVLSDDSRGRGPIIPETELDQLMLEAEELARRGEHEQSVAKLAALAAKLEVELVRLRHRQTLVHELKFGTIEEEYAYERERNRSYTMLLQMAISHVEVAPTGASQPPQILQVNESERERAQSVARAGDVAQALKIIEEATDELVRALRKTGMYLP